MRQCARVGGALCALHEPHGGVCRRMSRRPPVHGALLRIRRAIRVEHHGALVDSGRQCRHDHPRETGCHADPFGGAFRASRRREISARPVAPRWIAWPPPAVWASVRRRCSRCSWRDARPARWPLPWPCVARRSSTSATSTRSSASTAATSCSRNSASREKRKASNQCSNLKRAGPGQGEIHPQPLKYRGPGGEGVPRAVH